MKTIGQGSIQSIEQMISLHFVNVGKDGLRYIKHTRLIEIIDLRKMPLNSFTNDNLVHYVIQTKQKEKQRYNLLRGCYKYSCRLLMLEIKLYSRSIDSSGGFMIGSTLTIMENVNDYRKCLEARWK